MSDEITVTAEELAEKFPQAPRLRASSEVFAYPVTTKKSDVVMVAYHRAMRKVRIQHRSGACIQFAGVPEEYFLEHTSHGATIDDKLFFHFKNKFLCATIAPEKALDWESGS